MSISKSRPSDNESTLDMARKAIKLAESLGATQAEIVIRDGYRMAVEIRNGQMSGSQRQSQSGVGVRAYIGNKLGISSSTLVNEEKVESVVQKAISLAKMAPEDKNFSSLPDPKDSVGIIPNTYDAEIVHMDADDLITIGDRIMKGAKRDTPGKLVINGQISANVNTDVVVNNNGLEGVSEGTGIITFSNNSVVESPSNVGSGFEFFVTRIMDDKISYEDIGNKATEKALATLNAKEIETKKMPVLFDQRAAQQSIQSIVGNGVSGLPVMLGTSYFSDKIGHELSVSQLTIVDNPHVPNGMQSTPIDAEGYPTEITTYMEKGVLMNYATDSYSAHKLGIENNGHARRFGFSGKPNTGIHQLHVSAGEDSLQQMLEDMKEGIYMESGVNTAGGSQNISAKINRGFYVKNGEIQHAVKNTMIGSDVFSFLKSITGISKELKIEFGVQTPAILINEMSISGASNSNKKSGPVMSI